MVHDQAADGGKEEPWQTSRDGIGAEVVSRVVAECVCSVRLMVDGTTDD